MLLDGRDIEPPGNLLSCRDGEALSGDGGEAAALEFVLKSLALDFGAFEDGISVAERVGQGFVREIVELL